MMTLWSAWFYSLVMMPCASWLSSHIASSQPKERVAACPESVTPEPGRWGTPICGAACRVSCTAGHERKLSMNVEPARAFRDNDNCMTSSSCASSPPPPNASTSPVPPSFELGAKDSQRWSLTLEDFYIIALFHRVGRRSPPGKGAKALPSCQRLNL